MKLLYQFVLFVPLFFMSAIPEDVIDRTAELLKGGNTHELAATFSSSIEITILGENNVYSNTQAEQALADFFKRCQPRSAKVLHRITSNTHYQYAVIILGTSNGSYRTCVSLKNVNGKFEVSELRIEAEKAK
ncbi:DUF4783 domain-containing protein [Mucilaginibacter sp. BT774]|uniref:DUF4783 domain-containing protein n=1 Tax=Mucilaginibacter sp. BT774 TaxID=3062276 RepID=UPI002675F756|nr:DUF4783 domain-containing protein [Mucilaginibacter sp. BT774]MDO3626031.1 DUF4783 domain-containing protein [Mucilaginibacter sp. BT774]